MYRAAGGIRGQQTRGVAAYFETLRSGEVSMTDLVDIALPAAAQATAETLGRRVQRSVTSGVRVRQIPRDEAELAIEYLREWGFSARCQATVKMVRRRH